MAPYDARVGTVDDFLDDLDAPTRAVFGRIRDLALEVTPDAEQGTSYGVPALLWNGKPLLGFAVMAKHLAIYPFESAAVDAVRDQLSDYSLSAGTVRFSVDHPLPEQAVLDLVRTRRDMIASAT